MFYFCAALIATLAQVAISLRLAVANFRHYTAAQYHSPFHRFLQRRVFRNVETVNLRVVLGAVLMVAGVVLITSR